MPPASAGQRRHAEHELVEDAHHHPHVRKQRVEIASGDVAEILDEHRARPDGAPAQALALPLVLPFGARRGRRLGRHEQDHVVVDRDVVPIAAQPEPGLGLDGFVVVAAPEEAHLAEVVERGGHLDPHGLALAMRLLDLGVRQLDEVRALEHRGEALDQIGVSLLDDRPVEVRVRVELGIEIEVVVAQPLELVEIFVVIDRRQEAADVPELLALLLAAERAVLDQRIEDVGLADRDELVALAVAVLVGTWCRLGCRHCVVW